MWKLLYVNVRKKLRVGLHGHEEPIRVIRNIDEAIASGEGARVFIDGVHHHGCGGNVPAVLQCSFQGPHEQEFPKATSLRAVYRTWEGVTIEPNVS